MTSLILKRGGLSDRVSDVLLFDATYWEYENFIDWAVGGEGRRLVSIFTEHLREDNLELMAMLTKRGANFAVFNVADMTPETLASREPLFIYIPKDTEDEGLGHNQVVADRDFFALWLSTSALGQRAAE